MADKLTQIEKFNLEAKSDPDLKGFSANHRRQLYALKISYGVVAKAARMLKISRQTFYNNCTAYAKYKAAFDEIKETSLDIVEDALMQNILAGDTTAIMYYLNCKGSSRGYFNSRKIDHTTNGESLNKGFYDFLKEVSTVERGDIKNNWAELTD